MPGRIRHLKCILLLQQLGRFIAEMVRSRSRVWQSRNPITCVGGRRLIGFLGRGCTVCRSNRQGRILQTFIFIVRASRSRRQDDRRRRNAERVRWNDLTDSCSLSEAPFAPRLLYGNGTKLRAMCNPQLRRCIVFLNRRPETHRVDHAGIILRDI